jgi:hypothetical protein
MAEIKLSKEAIMLLFGNVNDLYDSEEEGDEEKDQFIVMRGGPGSGHFDHAGRPGEVGGSAPSGGSGGVAPEVGSGPSGEQERGPASAELTLLVDPVSKWPDIEPWNASKEAVQNGEIPGLRFDPGMSRGVVAHARVREAITVGPKWFEGSVSSRIGNLYHEVGHRVAAQHIASGDDWTDVLEPFRDGKFSWRNFAGFSNRPEEFLADVYAELIVGGAEQIESGPGSEKYLDVYRTVQRAAEQLGYPSKPIFKWAGPSGERELVKRGGPGSGHHGREGRPGEVRGES